MPTYVYRTIPTDGSRPRKFEVTQSMKDAPLTHDDKGVPVKRVISGGFGFAMNGKTDPNSATQFRERTSKGGTVGDLWDRSKELSEMRAQANGGEDPVKQKYYRDFRRSRKGTPHPTELAESQRKTIKNANEKLKSKGIKISLNQ